MRIMKVLLGVVLAASLIGATGCGEVKGSRLADAAVADPDGPIVTPIDAAVDTMIDGPAPLAKFDIAYINKFTIAWNFAGTGFAAFGAVVNVGKMPLNLKKLTIVSVTDDQPTIDSTFAVMPSDMAVEPGYAAGLLGRTAVAKIIESNLMMEEVTDESLNFGLAFPNFNNSFIGKTVTVQATIRIEDAELVLPIAVTFVASEVTSSDTAARLSSH